MVTTSVKMPISRKLAANLIKYFFTLPNQNDVKTKSPSLLKRVSMKFFQLPFLMICLEKMPL